MGSSWCVRAREAGRPLRGSRGGRGGGGARGGGVSATRSPRPPSPHWRRLPHENYPRWHRASYFARRCRDHEAQLIVASHSFLYP